MCRFHVFAAPDWHHGGRHHRHLLFHAVLNGKSFAFRHNERSSRLHDGSFKAVGLTKGGGQKIGFEFNVKISSVSSKSDRAA